MNRTFYAFGMLLLLLVTTTWAVNSGSRWTTRREAPRTGTHCQSLRRHPGGAACVIVLPEPTRPRTVSRMQAAQVLIAPQMAALPESVEPIECLSHGDAVYDFAVYGVTPTARPISAPVREAHGKLQVDAMMQLFAALSASPQPAKWQGATWVRPWAAGQWMMYARGLQHWAGRQADRLPLVWLARQLLAEKVARSAPVSWPEYAELLDEGKARPLAPQAVTIHLAEASDVLSGHWLRYSAASTLNRLAHLLEWTAVRLERPEELVSATTR